MTVLLVWLVFMHISHPLSPALDDSTLQESLQAYLFSLINKKRQGETGSPLVFLGGLGINL